MPINPLPIPPEVVAICRELHAAGFSAYLVGGAVRDLLRGRPPLDWDVATSARPEEVLALFPGSLPTGLKYGTVTVLRGGVRVEVTTFRAEEAYTDGRHPDRVVFGVSLAEDLARRDFTVNAMAYDPLAGRLIDPYGGRRDLARKIVRPVGDPSRRFQEDALRMLRLYRFVATLEMRPDPKAEKAIVPSLLGRISPERIRDELSKLLLAPRPLAALWGLARSGLLVVIAPEFAPMDRALLRHSFTAVQEIAAVLHLRLAALLHDLGKPATRKLIEGKVHFYGHDEIGAELARDLLTRLRFAGETVELVTRLVRLHMFQLSIPPSGPALRRLLQKAGGPERLRDLLELRRADILATGRISWPTAVQWQKLIAQVEEFLATRPAFSLRDLALDGHDVMRILGIGPGPAVGAALRALLEKVLENPELNNREDLERLLREGPLTS
ncbi:MAG: CCA tRNA nucleotidyltransferase [Bacillota bacterium]